MLPASTIDISFEALQWIYVEGAMQPQNRPTNASPWIGRAIQTTQTSVIQAVFWMFCFGCQLLLTWKLGFLSRRACCRKACCFLEIYLAHSVFISVSMAIPLTAVTATLCLIDEPNRRAKESSVPYVRPLTKTIKALKAPMGLLSILRTSSGQLRSDVTSAVLC